MGTANQPRRFDWCKHLGECERVFRSDLSYSSIKVIAFGNAQDDSMGWQYESSEWTSEFEINDRMRDITEFTQSINDSHRQQ